MLAIFFKEINEFLDSIVGYVVIIVFLLATGLVIWVLPDYSILAYDYASMQPLFTFGPYLFMFLIPAVTMKSFAEEKKTGTIELLFTLPFRDWQIIVGKYLASYFLVLLALLPTLIYYYSVYQLGSPTGNLDTAGIIGSYIGLVMLGGVFVSVGIISSALTGNQIVSFLLAVFLCFFFYDGIEILVGSNGNGKWPYMIQQLGIMPHYANMSKGLLELGDFGYFLLFIVFILYGVQITLSSKRL